MHVNSICLTEQGYHFAKALLCFALILELINLLIIGSSWLYTKTVNTTFNKMIHVYLKNQFFWIHLRSLDFMQALNFTKVL